METPDQDTIYEDRDPYAPEYGKYELSYPELCSEFLTALAKSVKNAALYGLAHPLVIEAVRKNASLLGLIFRAKKEESLTVSFMNDAWLFNETAVPAVTQESQNMNAFFKARRITGLTFLAGIQSFELAALCEFLAAPAKNRPDNFMEEFFSGKGVTNIKAEAVRYIKESGFTRQDPYRPAQAEPEQPRRQEPAPEPVKAQAPRPAQQPLRPAPALQPRPAQQPRPAPAVQPRPQQPAQPVQQRPERFEELKKPAALPAHAAPAQAARPPAAPQRPAPQPAAAKPAPTPAAALFGAGPGKGPGKGPGPGGAGAALFGSPAPAAQPAAAPEPVPQQPASALAAMSFGGILKGLVESAVKDPKDRVQAYEEAMKMIKETMEQQIADSTKAIAAEKEQAIRTRSRTEQVLSHVAEGKVIVDKQGKILMMNPAAEEIAGTKLADAVGRHISEHMRPGEHFLTLSKDMDLTGANQLSGEVQQQGDEHMGRALRRSMALLEDDEGRVLGTYTTLPEISKYREAQKLQEEFLSRITHDLQSPLSSITSALEMLTDAAGNKLDTTENKFLDISIRNSHRLSQMIKGILDFSKLQSGKLDMHPQPTLMAPIVAEATEGLMPWARTKNITLSVRPVPEDLSALADAPRIVQVLTNLISNAIKATPEGGTVTVAAACNPGEEGGVLFGVRDTGHGIPKEDLDKLFHKFVQLSSYDTQEGVGLGLAIVSDFVKLHGGRVWVESEEGKGATFYFTLLPAEASCPA
ncbi:MAG: ATP-binding protein [Elusimicrobiales bacterium]|nr:ATP-binding protein [Elusimicrobiales bacterium]